MTLINLPSDMEVSAQGHELTISGEIVSKPNEKSYKCSVDTWTIWVGHANESLLINGTVNDKPYSGYKVVEGLTITPEEGWRIYRKDKQSHTHLLRRNVNVPLTQDQFDVLADLEFQIPVALSHGSDLLAALIGGRDDNGDWIGPKDYHRAGEELLRWRGSPPEAGIYRRSIMRYCLWHGLPWRWVKYSSVSNVNLSTQSQDIWRMAGDVGFEIPNTKFMLPEKESAPIAEAPPVIVQSASEGPTTEAKRIVIKEIEEVKPEVKPEIKTVSEPEKKVTSATFNLGASETTAFTDLKSMLLARRFWGWLLIVFGRTQVGVDLARMQPQLADSINYVVGDAVMFTTTSGVIMMVIGEALKWWGERKATKGLK